MVSQSIVFRFNVYLKHTQGKLSQLYPVLQETVVLVLKALQSPRPQTILHLIIVVSSTDVKDVD